MCIIIIREPNVELDYEKFKTAVDNNPHGWGISAPDGEGKLFTYREVDPVLNTNAEELYEYLLSEFKDSKFMLHLRYTTAGETVLRNAHPFPVLEKSTDGVDVRMAHNGTLFDYEPGYKDKNSWESDTRVFNRTFIRPLFKRLIRGMDSKDIMQDDFTQSLVGTQLTAMSVVTLLDGHGNTMLVNEAGNGGFTDADGTYFSNKYSFNVDHRKPKAAVTRYPGVDSSSTGKTGTTATTTTSTSGHSGGGKTTSFTNEVPKKFTELHDMTHMEDLFNLSDEAIEMVVEREPEEAVLLIKELLFNLYTVDKKHKNATRLLAARTKLLNKQSAEIEGKVNDKAA